MTRGGTLLSLSFVLPTGFLGCSDYPGVEPETARPVATVSPAPAPSGVPAALIDLSTWRLELPVEDPADPGDVLRIEWPELQSFQHAEHFFLSAETGAVVFRAHAGATTTINSTYPRSELREMVDGRRAEWFTTTGSHTLVVKERVTHLPKNKAETVAAQIHDTDDDVLMVRLEGSRLFVEGRGEDLGVLAEPYVLGEWFTVKIHASAGVIDVFFNDMTVPKVTLTGEAASCVGGCFFKAGCYTQSNASIDAATEYAQVEIQSLEVSHQ